MTEKCIPKPGKSSSRRKSAYATWRSCLLPEKYKPGEKAKIDLRLTGMDGEPFTGGTVLTVYDKAVEYISGGSNVQDIRDFFWKWVRRHYPRTTNSLDKQGGNLVPIPYPSMKPLGVFGNLVSPEEDGAVMPPGALGATRSKAFKMESVAYSNAEPEALLTQASGKAATVDGIAEDAAAPPSQQEEAVHVRTEFADTAFWAGVRGGRRKRPCPGGI